MADHHQASTSAAATSRSDPNQPTDSRHKKKVKRDFYDVNDLTNKVDIGSKPGTRWTLSSFKPGSGVAQLRDKDLTKLWQSDGSQPHYVDIQFAKRTAVTHVSIYLDVKQDDSYTPTKILIKAGTNYSDLVEVRYREFESPQGWKHFHLSKTDLERDEEDEGMEEVEGQGEHGGNSEKAKSFLEVYCLKVCVLANHLNGKDTHVRSIMVFGPKVTGRGEDEGADDFLIGIDGKRKLAGTGEGVGQGTRVRDRDLGLGIPSVMMEAISGRLGGESGTGLNASTLSRNPGSRPGSNQIGAMAEGQETEDRNQRVRSSLQNLRPGRGLNLSSSLR
ncbi:APC10-domain-containing protein [Violaceomyces palustris]|uniref:APC10-domain-containing protein n=1 Tax=Violaceomyces palustris TaxID=1673888 RepID=A0ACD0P8W7_9BASI|nr:APC10-domain-containing protein [Violaceomyces palustris]